MRYLLYLILIAVLPLTSCEDDDRRYNNPNLIDLNFQVEVNLNLPQYSQLQFVGNSATLSSFGIKGIVIHNVNGNQFTAFELSDPNHPPSSCSKMTISGIEASCPCATDDNRYSILTGQPLSGNGEYGMKPYRLERDGNILLISN